MAGGPGPKAEILNKGFERLVSALGCDPVPYVFVVGQRVVHEQIAANFDHLEIELHVRLNGGAHRDE